MLIQPAARVYRIHPLNCGTGDFQFRAGQHSSRTLCAEDDGIRTVPGVEKPVAMEIAYNPAMDHAAATAPVSRFTGRAVPVPPRAATPVPYADLARDPPDRVGVILVGREMI